VDPANPCLATSATAIRGTTRQSNTHSIESREVRYPWHPWYGLTVWIYQTVEKAGEGISRCRIEQNLNVRLFELPEWMFDAAACSQMQIRKAPALGCRALWDLKTLLECHRSRCSSDSIVEGQHQSLRSLGGADAKATEPTPAQSTRSISHGATKPTMAGPSVGDSTKDDETAGATAARTLRKRTRLRQRKGGGR
jgi:hypothetical protein